LGHGPDGLNIKILCTTIYITTLNIYKELTRVEKSMV